MLANPDYQTEQRMAAKLRAIPLPDLAGKSVLDVGCDMRFWCDLATSRGAAKVVGVDRGRFAREHGEINLADVKMDLGRQYHELGTFDVVFMFSLYHHCYASAGGDHNAIWYWLSRRVKQGGVVLWENPVDTRDPVVRMNVSPGYQGSYTRESILEAANRYFDYEYVGPALHEKTREVYRFTRRHLEGATLHGFIEKGGGGARHAFEYHNRRRCEEFATILGWIPFAGSLNARLALDFPWDENYYRVQLLDLQDRAKGISSPWSLRWARFYPVQVEGSDTRAVVFRFDGEAYDTKFVEIVSEKNLSLPVSPLFSDYGSFGVYNSVSGEPATPITLRLTR